MGKRIRKRLGNKGIIRILPSGFFIRFKFHWDMTPVRHISFCIIKQTNACVIIVYHSNCFIREILYILHRDILKIVYLLHNDYLNVSNKFFHRLLERVRFAGKVSNLCNKKGCKSTKDSQPIVYTWVPSRLSLADFSCYIVSILHLFWGKHMQINVAINNSFFINFGF